MAFEGLSEKLAGAFKRLKSKGKLSEVDVKGAMREVRVALLEADVNYKVAKDFVKTVSERCVGAEVLDSLTPAQQVIKIVNEELMALMGGEESRIHLQSKPPTVIMVAGLQGAGKTTHIGKLAYHYRKEGRRPLLVAADIYRPAAIEQLQVVGKNANCEVFAMGQINPIEIVTKAMKHSKDYGFDIVLIDTAGRLHIDETLMDELKRVKAAVAPHEILLVIDAMTGQDAVNVAETFNETLEIDGVILTKLDGDTRGGAALSVRAVTGKPIKFVGTGEKQEDLEIFYPDRMANRILGMGDMLSLIEKAQENFDAQEAEKMIHKMRENKFDLNDMLEQLNQFEKMGSLEQIAGMMPGQIGKQLASAEVDSSRIGRFKAIIYSMTTAERENPKLVNPARKRRIAAGSGTQVQDVNRVLRQFEETSKTMKQLMGKKGKGMRRRLMSGLPI